MNFTEYVKIREEKFGAVIFETLKEKVFVTNKTGKDILSLLRQNKPLEEIVGSLLNSYQGSSEDIKNDVESFIHQLKENNLLISNSII